jgi:hypothetical protein
MPTAFHASNDRCLLAPHALTNEDLAELAFAELRRAGAGMPAVSVYLLQTIALVADAARAIDAGDRIAPFIAQARLVVDNADSAGLITTIGSSSTRATARFSQTDCRPPVTWDHFELMSASGMGPPERQ